MSDGHRPSIPSAPDDSRCPDTTKEARTLTQAELDALSEFFRLLDEWDQKKRIA
jgi:hypothetical protein